MPTKATTIDAPVPIADEEVSPAGSRDDELRAAKAGRHRWVVERTHGWFAGLKSGEFALKGARIQRSAVEAGCRHHPCSLRGSVC